MESTETPRLALDEIKTVAFKQGIRGYVVDEVDEFLDRAGAEVDQIREQMHQMRQQLRQASERIRQLEGSAGTPAPSVAAPVAPTLAPAPVMTPAPASSAGAEQVTAMITMAQQFIDQAQQEAEAKAREMTVAAQERAREIVTEARSRAEDEVTRLNGLKQRLSEDVTLLTRQLDSERNRLTTVLAELSQWIESSMHLGSNDSVPSLPRGATLAPSAPARTSAPVTTQSPAPTEPHTPAPNPPEPAPSLAPATTVVPVVTDVPPRPVAPPPAPPATIGQILNFESSSEDRA